MIPSEDIRLLRLLLQHRRNINNATRYDQEWNGALERTLDKLDGYAILPLSTSPERDGTGYCRRENRQTRREVDHGESGERVTQNKLKCARCGRMLPKERGVYSRWTKNHYCWPGEGCSVSDRPASPVSEGASKAKAAK